MKFFKKKNSKASLFMFTSVASLIAFWFCASFLLLFFFGSNKSSQNVNANNKQSDKEKAGVVDPFITRNPNLEPEITSPILDTDDPEKGKKGAGVTIVEYSDFDCSFCAKQEEIVRELIRDKYEDQVRLIWKDYPVADKSSGSFKASRAARCARKQDKFWDYHDRLFDSQREMNKGLFIDLANDLNLDINKFLDCYNNGEVDDEIMSNIEEADSLGLPGIPFFYVNDQEILGDISKEDLEKIIKLELKD